MKRYFFIFTLIVVSFLFGITIFASETDIQYPIQELGNCADKAACQVYCDKANNTEVCLAFAEKHNLMSSQEIQTARKFTKAGTGPGGCASKDSCEAYCNAVDHLDECINFAEKNDLMPPQELEEAKKVQAAKARGVKMPACGSKKQCDTYCSDSSHMEECITFAQEAGLMSTDELEKSKKALTAIKAGVKPPPCQGKEACDVYCSQEEHFDACLDFALAAGFMDPKEAEMAKKTRGKGPGGCRGKEACDAFCQQEGNMETCAQFAYDNGMMSKEEFEIAKKTGGKGPGGCKGKEECESFCQDPANQETCFNFAKDNGLISQEDIQRMEEGKRQFQSSMQKMPPEVYSCLEETVGADTMAKFKNGEAMPGQEIGDQMRVCFEKNMPRQEPGAPGEGGAMPPGNMAPGTTGPGGCATPEECQQYCQTNPEECKNFQSPPPQSSSQFMPGPGFNQGGPNQEGQPGQYPPSQDFGGPMPCQGENCPSMPQQPGQYPPSQSGGQPTPSCQGDDCYKPMGERGVQQPPMPGQKIMPCEGENCRQGPAAPPMPSPMNQLNKPSQQFAPGTEGNTSSSIERIERTESEPMRPPEIGEGGPLPPVSGGAGSSSGLMAPPLPPSSAPGGGGGLAPGESVPLAPPAQPSASPSSD